MTPPTRRRQSTTPNSQQAKMTADPARAERLGKRQLEQSVCWTSGERLRCLWYQFRLTWQEINYASRGMVELQKRQPGQSSANSPTAQTMTAEPG
jgi:hypothetical protein